LNGGAIMDLNQRLLACEASALAAEPIAPKQGYFTPITQLCKPGGSCSGPNPYDLESLRRAYTLCAAAEGLSKSSITIVLSSVRYLERFLRDHGASTDARDITPDHLRAYTLHLKGRACFEDHPLTPAQPRGLSGHTINTYLRSLRIFFSWLVTEEYLEQHPFDRVKVPKAPHKVMATFSEAQIQDLLGVIDIDTPQGYRNFTLVLMMLDCGLRLAELTGLRLPHVRLEEGEFKVMGKGSRERVLPMGRQLVRCLARYIARYRPEPAVPRVDQVFLTADGWPLPKDRVENMVTRYGKRAGITGVRCSPHTLRHTAAVSFVRNGGDAFSLQRLLGHSTLDMTRRYCELADVDVKMAHRGASPVDHLDLGQRHRG
jgi:integrase/recombinase XerD